MLRVCINRTRNFFVHIVNNPSFWIKNKTKMVGNTGTLMTMSIAQSKPRKRDESFGHLDKFREIEAKEQNDSQNIIKLDNSYNVVRDRHIRFFKPEGCSPNNTLGLETITFTRTNGGCSASNAWIFPPKAPSPNIYNCVNHDSMAFTEQNGFKGLKKQFSGRFKRLVSHKKDVTAPIPPELKPQLKTIYVY